LASLNRLERKIGYAPAIVEDLLAGSRTLRRAFLEGRLESAGRDAPLSFSEGREPGAFLITRGFAYRSTTFPDARRAILDVLVPGDIVGLESLVLGRLQQDVTAAGHVSGKVLSAERLRELLGDQTTAAWLFALMCEANDRMDRIAASIARCDARERIAAFFLDIYDRLRRRELITGNSFNLPLTQEQMGDHLGLTMVHVNRTLRQLREDRLLVAARGVVVLMNVDRLREIGNPGAQVERALAGD